MLDFLLNALKWYGIVVGSVFGFMIAFVVVMLLVLSISIRAASPRQVILVVREQGEGKPRGLKKATRVKTQLAATQGTEQKVVD